MPRHDLVFLLDVDNTLLDNDRVVVDLKRHLAQDIGDTEQARYWQAFEELRKELGYADYLGALQRYRLEMPHEVGILRTSLYLTDYPFANRIFPQALDVVDHLGQFGPTVILSDGDVVFQPRKVQRSGLLDAVDSRVLIYVHKERELDDVERRYPAAHYVMVDDKVRLLAATKAYWGARVTTVFVHQGHYARDAVEIARHATPDVNVERIGMLLDWTGPALRQAARQSVAVGP